MHVMYGALRVGFLDDGNMLHGSTPSLCPCLDVLLLRLGVLCLVDSHR
jgi:hypothetical protein